MNDQTPQMPATPDGAASVLTVRLEHIGDETTLCWNCPTVYSMAADQCPSCCATNANHDLESAQMEMKDKVHIDHDWKFQDDSFDHEFGTERVYHWQCERCGATREMESADYHDDGF